MAKDLQALEDWVQPLIAKLKPAERRQLARTLARELRKSQRERIARQDNPDGSPFEPRKPQARNQGGFVRRRAMFSKIRQAKYLRLTASAGSAQVGFVGRVAQIARVHQHGLKDKIDPGGAVYHYPQRRLLGFGEADRKLVENLLIDHLS